VPLKPKTDAAFLFALIHVMLHESGARALDLEFLARRTGSPYLVGPKGTFLRDRATRKPLVWDRAADRPWLPRHSRHRGSAGGQLRGRCDRGRRRRVTCWPRACCAAKPPSPGWWSTCANTRRNGRRKSATSARRRFGRWRTSTWNTACVGQTIEIDGKQLPYRPVAVTLGKTVNNGWGGFECCWARTMLATLVGALEVPGGTVGTTVRIVRPMAQRLESARPGPDGFMNYPLNPPTRNTGRPGRTSATPTAAWCRWRRRPLEPGARADPLLLDVPRRHARRACRA
jgi:phenylacetyl-CoA:acceptor oxidoreductase